MHFRPIVLHKGLNPENGVVPKARTSPNGRRKASHDSVPIGSTTMRL